MGAHESEEGEDAEEKAGNEKEVGSSQTEEESQVSLTLNGIYNLGKTVQYLKSAGYHGYNIENILENIGSLDYLLSGKNFNSSNVSKGVSRYYEGLSDKYEDSEDGEKIKDSDGDQLNQIIDQWDALIKEEIQGVKRISVADIDAIDEDMLSENPSALYKDEVWEWLEDRPQSDIKESCQTLVVGCPTASVMLSLRAVEHCLNEWYEEEKGESIEATWGQVLGALEDKFGDAKDQPSVLSSLNYLLDKRNEVMHPKESPNIEEAVTTLFMVRGNITEIHQQING